MDYVALSAGDLVRACTQTGDAAAWEEFIRRFHRLIASVVLRVARRWGESSRQVIDDLVQDTYLKLCADECRLLRVFKARNPEAFYAYLKVVTANLVHDHYKGTHSAKRGAGVAEVPVDPNLASAVDPHDAEAAAKGGERQILLREMDDLLRKVAQGPNFKRDRRVFWLYYRAGLTASSIAALPTIELSTKGVESTISRLTRLLREEVAKGQGLPAQRQRESEGI